MELVEALIEDHKKIKKLINEGKKKDLEISYKKSIFKELAQIVTAHAKSEEKVVYIPAREIEEIKNYAYEGFEEHGLVDQLVEEDKSTPPSNNIDVWEAKFKVICDLLQHHVEEEEESFFPKLKKVYSSEDRKEKGNEYKELFQHLMKHPKDKDHLDQVTHHMNH